MSIPPKEVGSLNVMSATVQPPFISARRRRADLALLAAASSTDNAESNVMTVLFPVMRVALDLSLTALGTIVAAAKLVAIPSSVLWALLARRFSRKTLLALCSGFWGVFVIACGFTNSFTQFIIIYTIAAAGFAGSQPIVAEIMGDLYGDTLRGRSTGYLFGAVALITAVSGPVFGQLSRFEDGWRYGYFISGGLCVVIGALILAFFRDPGLGAADGLTQVPPARLNIRDAFSLFRIPTFSILTFQRLIGGQSLVLAFGVVLLVDAYGFQTATASVIVLPFGVCYLVGILIGGRLSDLVASRFPRRGRIMFLQGSQVIQATVIMLATQFNWGGISPYIAFFGLAGFFHGWPLVAIRPIVLHVVPPAQRGLAIAVQVGVVESLSAAGFSILAGILGDQIGLVPTFAFCCVATVLACALLSGLLYRNYHKDGLRVSSMSRTEEN